MLTEHDIQHIKETRREIVQMREEPIILHKQVQGAKDPFTGDYTHTTVTETVMGTWKTLVSNSGGEGEIQFQNGVHVVTDDAIINLDISIDVTGVTKVVRNLTGEEYVIKASDILGMGEPNRHFILLELIK